MRKKAAVVIIAAVLACVMAVGCNNGTSMKESADASAETLTEESTEKSTEESTETSVETFTESSTEESAQKQGIGLEDGVYSAEFDTDSSMFHVNEANDKRGILTVENGEMTIHVSLASKKIVNLFVGTAEDAEKEGAAILKPTIDTVTYSDGMSEEVYGFDIPVPGIDEEFCVALLGSKDKWYDHKVSVTDPQPQ